MFKKVLVANRGEIAVRVIRALKELGIQSVAVYSKADEEALHTKLADEAYLIGEPPAIKSYLNLDAILQAAKEANAEAIHPGYGFFAENADYIERIEKAGFVFIGPSAAIARKMGDKVLAKRLMQEAGLPIPPGSGFLEDAGAAQRAADELGYPVILKAAFGGGGIGTAILKDKEALEGAFLRASKMGAQFFGSPKVYIERYFEKAHHVEVQVVSDNFGCSVHLFERDCSIQRRYQKLVEESPSPLITEETRQAMAEAALRAVKHVGYHSVGTIEFLVDEGQRFYFLEMNTRIQVEHPVTEMRTGIDLVREQVRVAAGEPLSFCQEDVLPKGHAIECRIYAEDPKRNFMPSPGVVAAYEPPGGPGVRVDGGIRAGSKVTAFYDPLLLKLLAWDTDRSSALERMRRALKELVLEGPKTLVPFHQALLNSRAFREGTYHVKFVEEEFLPDAPL